MGRLDQIFGFDAQLPVKVSSIGGSVCLTAAGFLRRCARNDARAVGNTVPHSSSTVSE
jgi:hypothetical protein